MFIPPRSAAMPRRSMLFVLAIVVTFPLSGRCGEESTLIAEPTLRLLNPQVKDQDDMCVWVHPERPEMSTVITSDKSAGFVFVYDLQGHLLQSVSVPKPGNIDIRQNARLGTESVDLVVVNQRTDGFKLVAFAVDPETRQLARLNGEPLLTGPNYGGCLAQDLQAGRVYFFCTSDTGTVEQHELLHENQGAGRIINRKLREIPIGKCEGAVADDNRRLVYISEETKGIWRVPVDPTSRSQPELIVRVGEHGVTGDLEGLALMDDAGLPILLVSDQGSSCYLAFDVSGEARLCGRFTVAGASETDGIEVVNRSLGSAFPQGVFLCHTDAAPRPVLGTPLQTFQSIWRK